MSPPTRWKSSTKNPRMDLQSRFIPFIKQIKLLQFGQRSLAISPYANGKKSLLFIQKGKKIGLKSLIRTKSNIGVIEWARHDDLELNWVATSVTECWSNEGGWGGSSSLVMITQPIDNPHFNQKRIWPKRANLWLIVQLLHSDTWLETNQYWLESS